MMGRYGLFSFGAQAYAIPLLRLRQIVHRHVGYRLPKLPAAVAEVLVIDGQLVPLVGLDGLTSQGTDPIREAEYKVLAESEGGVVAFPAELVCGVVSEQKGVFLASGEGQQSGVAGIFEYQGKEFKILDIDFLALGMTLRSDGTA